MQRNVRLSLLLDFYGGLLTQHQRSALGLSCEDDLSLSEIGEQRGVSRQAVHDAIHRAEARLEELEQEMGLVEKYSRMSRLLEGSVSLLEGAGSNAQAAAQALPLLKEALSIWTE